MSAIPPLPDPLGAPTVDTHCHLDLGYGDEAPLGVDEALARAAAVGVTRIVQVGCDVAGARWAVDVAERYDALRAAIALHPNEAPRLVDRSGRVAFDEAFAVIESLAALDAAAAVGETGLDHFRTGPDGRDVQEESFRRHLELAAKLGKPVVIHDRDAHEDVVRVLLDSPRPDRVVFHCFSGDAALARTCAEHGWYASFAGTVTFRNAAGLREAAAAMPAELLLVETDAPYLAPVPYRGRPNASYLVPLTVRALAAVRDVDVDALAAVLAGNAEAVFGPF